jgi:hypothetical protein
VTQRSQLTTKRRDAEHAKREKLFGEFISEAARVYGDALSHQKDDVCALVGLYAMLGRIPLVSSREVVVAAEAALVIIAETYLAPNRTLQELHVLAQAGGLNMLTDLSECCQRELDAMLNKE